MTHISALDSGVLDLTCWQTYTVTKEYQDIIQKYLTAQFFAVCPA